MRKNVVLLIILILAPSSSLTWPLCSATSTPSVPEFSLKFVDASYDVPTTHTIDPYTGQTIITPAEHIDNRTIEVKVKNQQFTPYADDESSFTIKLYYNIRVRGHFDGNWTEVFSVDNSHPVQSNSDYTIISLPLDETVGPFASLPTNSSSQIDFQVEAMIGYFSRTVGFASWYFAGMESGWSGTQTLTIPAVNSISTPSATSSISPTKTSSQPSDGASVGLNLAVVEGVVIVFLGVVVVLLVFYLRSRSVGHGPA